MDSSPARPRDRLIRARLIAGHFFLVSLKRCFSDIGWFGAATSAILTDMTEGAAS